MKQQLARLQDHLLESEENHTHQILAADKRAEDLQAAYDDLLQQKERVEADRAAELAHVQEQLRALQMQFTARTDEHDGAEQRILALERELEHERQAAQKLQSVLAAFDDEKSAAVHALASKHDHELAARDETIRLVQQRLSQVEQEKIELGKQLDEVSSELAQRHTEQGLVESLRTESARLKAHMGDLQSELEEARTKLDALGIDKTLLQNAITQYFTTDSKAMRQDVLRVISDICDFNDELKAKAGLIPRKGLFGLFSSAPTTTSSSSSASASSPAARARGARAADGREDSDDSLSHQFVNFLLREVKQAPI